MSENMRNTSRVYKKNYKVEKVTLSNNKKKTPTRTRREEEDLDEQISRYIPR